MIPESRLNLLIKTYPEIEQGRADAASGKWTDIIGHNQSFAYEIGRMLAVSPPEPSQFGGFVYLAPEIEKAIAELG
jgi:hypothetical protein